MRDTRNPFKLRRAENIDTDTTFLSLFEPGILDVIAESGLPDTVQLIRSAAGGGKTSLLRLFTPSVLRRLFMRRVEDQDLFSRLQALAVIDERGPRLLGVTLLCGRNYAGLEDLRLDPAVRTRLFLGLLNARVVLAVLRSALVLKDLEYPSDLGRLTILRPPDDGQQGPTDIDYPCSGTTLYDWARKVEKTICSALDSFGPMRVSSLPGLDSLFSLSILQAQNVAINGEPVADRILIMMDDIHMLTSGQRSLLVERVIEARSKTGIWIAERFEALSTQELLASGSNKDRDRHDPIELEWYWRGRHERFEKHVMRIADRRVRASVETELDAFRSCLEDSIDTAEYAPIFERAIGVIRERINQRGSVVAQFRDWIAVRQGFVGSPRDRALAWRALEILIERRLRRPQKGLFDEDADAPIPSQELLKEADSSVKNAAEMFLAREFGLPYYFGAERIARLASLNIEQFLGLSGGIFEEVIAAELLRSGSTVTSARRQHALMKRAAESFWSDIPNKVRHGREVRAFLESVGRFAEWYTYRASAPNDPGVGGTAIRMSERRALMSKEALNRRPERQRFADLLASALAHNYLVADLDYSCKGDTWMVLNLNRLLCVHFNLPLGYGLYKERPLDELCRWVDEPFVAPKQEVSAVVTAVQAGRWEQYLLLRGARVRDFWEQHFQEPRDLLLLLGRGFDPRMCMGLSTLLAAGGVGKRDILGLDFREGPRSPSLNHEELVDLNWAAVTAAAGARGDVSIRQVEFWSSEARRISSQSARDLFDSEEAFAAYTDVVVDISSMPRSVYFPLIARILYLLDHQLASPRKVINLHVLVAEDPGLDASIQEEGIDEKAEFMASFSGGFDEEAVQTPKVWLPMLGENRGTQFDRIHDRVKPDEICPVLPSPSRDPRRADDIVIEYHERLFDQHRLDGRGFLYAAEQNPFEVYRQLRGALSRYDDVFGLLGGCRVAISPLSSKLMSLGALLVAYELKEHGHGVGIAHIESQGYALTGEPPEAELFGLWLAGECDAN